MTVSIAEYEELDRRHQAVANDLAVRLATALAEVRAIETAAEEILSWSVNDTSVLLTNPPQNAGLFHAQRVLRAAMANQKLATPDPPHKPATLAGLFQRTPQ